MISRIRGRLWVPGLVALLIVVALTADRTGVVLADDDEGSGKAGLLAKLGFDLAELFEEHEEHMQREGDDDDFEPSNPLLPVIGNRVLIDAVAVRDGDELELDLEALGLQDGEAYGSMVSGRLSIEDIDDIAGLGSLAFARIAYAMTTVGSVTSQGDVAMRSDVARVTYGVNGAGVTVGALSDSFDCNGGAASDVASSDLPAGIIVLDDTACPGTDEGRAMMQLIHDVSPGASQAFHTAFKGQADFASGIAELVAAGADVIVDDVIYLAEPMFQDGIIAQAVDDAVSAGVSYFSSAGNNARDAYESAFVPGGSFGIGSIPSAFGAPFFWGGMAQNFGGGDVFQSITIPSGATLYVSFQWDDPFFSVSGAPGADTDMDVYLLDGPASIVLAGGVTSNSGGDPVEVFGVTNNGPTATFNIMLVKFSGPDPGLMKYVRFGSSTVNEFDTASGSVYGHANAAGAEAVGAAFYGYTPAFGVSPPLLEPFSSAGPTAILFDTAGARLIVPEVRDKPEIVAPDGTNTTFFGSDIIYPPTGEPDGWPNFFGTSAAAPHAAGVAALMLDADPLLSPAAIYGALETTAIDMNGPFDPGFPDGFDFDTGFGLIQADLAVGTVAPAEDTTAPSFSSGSVAADGTTVTVTFDEALAASAPPGSAFVVTADNVLHPGTSAPVAISAAAVTFTLESALAAGETATLAYTQPPSDPRIRDAAGNATASFSGAAITNDTAAPVAAPQFARPSSDARVGRWSSTPLWQKLDEENRNDSDFITSPMDPESPSNDVEIGLAAVTDPESSSGHVVRYTFRETGEEGTGPDLTVELRQGSTVIASWNEGNIADAPWTLRERTLTSAQADAITDYSNLRIRYRATTIDEDEQVDWSWAEFEVPSAVDTTPPAAPATPDLAAASDSGYSNTDNITSDTTPALTGTAEANSTVEVIDGATSLGTTLASPSGGWSFTPGSALSDGDHSFTATAIDAANNTSAPSAALSVTIDTQGPNDPISVESTSHIVGPTSGDNTIDMSWTAATDNGLAGVDGYASVFNTTSSPTCDQVKDLEETATGVTSAALADGAYYFHICTVDNAGNWTATVTVGPFVIADTTPPAPPSKPDLAPASDSGDSNTDNITSDATPTLIGTAEANSTVEVFDGATSLGTTTASSSGGWSFTPGTALSDGDHSFTATATDAANNTSAPSAALTVTIDTLAPTATVNQAGGQADPTSASPINFAVVFSGDVTGFTGADVTLGGTAGAATASVTGGPAIYNVAVSGIAADGTVTASIGASAAADAAGNGNLASTSEDNEVTFDTTAPTATVNQAGGQADPTSASPINFAVVFSEDVSGFSDTDVTLGGTAGAATATVSGGPAIYNVAVSGMTADGTVTASIGASAATDAAGNGNLASTSEDNEVTFDTTAPQVPSTSPADGATDVSVGTLVTATFSEAMDPSTLSAVTFTLKETATGTAVSGTVSYVAGTKTGTFTPSAPLGAETSYTVQVRTGVRDLAGNGLDTAKTWSFTTGPAITFTLDREAFSPVVADSEGSGAEFFVYLWFHNDGAQDLTNVTVWETLNSGLVAQGEPGIDQISDGSAQWLPGLSRIEWSVGNVRAGNIAFLSYKVRLPVVSGFFPITSNVTASGSSSGGPTTVIDATASGGQVDFLFMSLKRPSEYELGEKVVVELAVGNPGDVDTEAPASQFDVQLVIPAGWNVLTVGQDGINETDPVTGVTTISWNLEGPIEARKQDAWKFQAEIEPTTAGLFEFVARFLGTPSHEETLRVGVQ